MIEKPLSFMMALGVKPSAKTVRISRERTQSADSFEFNCSKMAPLRSRVTSSSASERSAGGSRPAIISVASSRIEEMLMFEVAALSMSIRTCLDCVSIRCITCGSIMG